jgi:hypothetical protein
MKVPKVELNNTQNNKRKPYTAGIQIPEFKWSISARIGHLDHLKTGRFVWFSNGC